MKKSLALLFALCVLAGVLTGCGSKIEEYSSETMTAAEQTAETLAEQRQPANSYEADTVVCTVDGLECTWEEYYYWLNNCRTSVESSLGEITDWDAANAYYTGNTNEQVVRLLAQDDMLYYTTVLAMATEAGVAPTDAEAEQELLLEADQLFGDGDGSLTAEEQAKLEAYLNENGVSYELQLKLAKYRMAEQLLFNHMAASIEDEQVVEWAQEQGYMHAKHILLMTIDSQTREPLDEETIAEKAATADYLLAELTEAKNAEFAAIEAAGDAAEAADSESASGEPVDPAQQARDDFEAYFDKLMNEYSEDTGLTTHPNGYMFLPGEMVAEFENGVSALDDDLGLSEVVESDYGYHIILRKALDPDTVVGYNSYGYEMTLRDYVRNNIFNQQISSTVAQADIQWADDFEQIDLGLLFATLSE